MTEIDARNLPVWALAAVILLAALAVFFLYGRERGLVPRRSGHLLTGLRILEVSVLILLAADPVVRVRKEVEVRGGLLVIVDVSRSMSIVDRNRATEERARDAEALGLRPGEIEESQRIDLVRRALEGQWLRELSRRFDVSVLALAKDILLLQPSPLDPAAPVPPAIPPAEGNGTDLGRPIAEEAARRPRGSLSGIVLFTDGNHHGERDPREAARALAALEAPLVAVGVGALERPPDLSLDAVEGPRKAFSGDQVAVSAVIAASGLTRRKVQITVEADEKTLGTVVADVAEGQGLTRVPISFPAGEPGRKKVTVRFPLSEGEVSGANNSCDFWLEVLSEKARVLFLDGAPRWEERYLRASWSRDANVELHRFLVTPPPERRLPGGFPRTRDEVFAHDVIVLGDIDPGIFTTEEIENLRDFAAVRGGALVLIAGERSMPYRWGNTPLAAALPVRLIEPPPPAGLGARIARDGLPLALTAAGETSEITRLVPGREQNLKLWQLLPEARWLSPMAGLEPGAEALVTVKPDRAATLPDMPPLPRKLTEPALAEEAARLAAERAAVVVTRAFGAGRVLLVTIDSTWKWRYRVGDEVHRKFWGQVVRWAVSTRLGAEDSHAKLGTDSLIYTSPATVAVEAFVESAPGKPFEEPFVDAVITRKADGKSARLRLEPVPRSGGRHRGALSLEKAGLLAPLDTRGGAQEFFVELDVPGMPDYSSDPRRARAAFVVEPAPDPESRDLACDTRLLEEMAAASGGRFLPFSRFQEASDSLPAKSRTEARTEESSPWDHPAALAPIVLGLLALEYVLRKRRNLV